MQKRFQRHLVANDPTVLLLAQICYLFHLTSAQSDQSTSAKITATKYLKHVRCSVPHLTNSIPTQHCMGHTVQILIVKQSSRRWFALHKPIEMQWDLLMVELVSPDPHHVKLASPWREDVCSMINGVLVTPLESEQICALILTVCLLCVD